MLRREMRRRSLALTAVMAALLAGGCSGGGSQGSVVPLGNGASLGSGNTVVRIFVPAGAANGVAGSRSTLTQPPIVPPPAGAPFGANGPPTPPPAAPAAPTSPPAPGSQSLAINVSGPATISQTLSVGPNSTGCSPAPGGSLCQLGLSLPAGTYAGTIGSAAIAFAVTPSTSNVLNLTLGGVPAQLAVVPGSAMSAPNAQGGIDLYGAGRHPLIVELLDANQNVMVGGGAVSFTMSQAGGSLPVTVSQASAASPNAFSVSAPASPAGSTAMLRATASYSGPGNPCVQSGAVCSGSVRVDVRQVLGVANSGTSTVTLYVNGQNAPLATISNGVVGPQTLVFDASGDLFVANQSGAVTAYAPPYAQQPVTIANGINHPQALAVDARGNLFVANGNGSNTVTLYSPPYGGPPAMTIALDVDDPVSLALDSSGDLFVVNSAASTVTVYAPPYSGTPTTISKGLNAPGSIALDGHGNLFVANLNSTPNSVVEYAAPFSNQSAPVATITNGVNEQGSIALMSANLFVPNEGANTVTEYAAPYAGAPTTIAGGQSQPVALAIDTSGNLYVANYGNNTITEYAPPYAGGSWATIASGVGAPLALALSPPTPAGPALLP